MEAHPVKTCEEISRALCNLYSQTSLGSVCRFELFAGGRRCFGAGGHGHVGSAQRHHHPQRETNPGTAPASKKLETANASKASLRIEVAECTRYLLTSFYWVSLHPREECDGLVLQTSARDHLAPMCRRRTPQYGKAMQRL